MTGTIDFSQSDQYTLSIRLSTDGFSFCVCPPQHPEDGCYRSYAVNPQRSMAANVKAFLADTAELGHTFGQTNLLIHSSRYTPVPFELFEDEQMEAIFYQNLTRQNNEIVLCNVLGRSNLAILFGMDKLTHLLLSERFAHARFFAAVSPQVEWLSGRNRAGDRSRLYAHLHPNSTDVFCFERGRLQLVNSYTTPTLDDRCYYLLNVWQQLGFDPEQDELHLTGLRNLCTALEEQLRPYLRNIDIMNPSTHFRTTVAGVSGEVPFDIQSLLICE